MHSKKICSYKNVAENDSNVYEHLEYILIVSTKGLGL